LAIELAGRNTTEPNFSRTASRRRGSWSLAMPGILIRIADHVGERSTRSGLWNRNRPSLQFNDKLLPFPIAFSISLSWAAAVLYKEVKELAVRLKATFVNVAR
jgi:hypothetical protein